MYFAECLAEVMTPKKQKTGEVLPWFVKKFINNWHMETIALWLEYLLLLWYTVFDLISAPALITAPPLPFYFIFTYYRPLDNLFLDFLLYFHLLSPTWRSFGTSSREQICVSAPGAY